MASQALVQERIDAVLAGLGDTDGPAVPDDLEDLVRAILDANPTISWDAALRTIID